MGCSDSALLAARFVYLDHALEVINVTLPAKLELGVGESCHVCTLQDLVLLVAIILEPATKLNLKFRHADNDHETNASMQATQVSTAF